ncbi:Ig-like domain-containing protein [Micromonospora sp. NPDC049679]|uniref:L,D-transpeptidase n=1 Tax=Micromonospora sp. NPDC049679 TaxID=3155920 RepID=UPI0033DFE626
MKGRRTGLCLVITAAAPLVLVGCTGKPENKEAVPPAPTVAITPATDSRNVPVSAEIGATVTGGKITEVTLTDAAGAKVGGAMRADGSTWLPDAALKHKQSYTARVTAVSDKGRTTTQTASFTTMSKPAKQNETTLYFTTGRTYGVAMPVTISFEHAVSKETRAAVQRRLFVTTDPPQPGVWHWDEDGKQVYYRAAEFWQPGTKINVRAALGGLPIGDRYGDTDHGESAKIGNKVTVEIDNATKQMSVFKDGKLARKIPVSMGKSSTPTSSGKMVIMEKFDRTTFDTRGDPNGGYVVDVDDAQRLTWGGEFIHSAPWSVGDQGYRNVSHGCTNVSPANANWLMQVTHVGDLVTIRGTEVKLDRGNGWTAWDMSWAEYVKGSALPVPEELKSPAQPAPPAAATPTPALPTPVAADPAANPDGE